MANTQEEVKLLVREIKRLGDKQSNNTYTVAYGKLFADDKVANIFEALLGTLRAAKKQKIITYEGELLLQGVHDKVVITLLKPDHE